MVTVHQNYFCVEISVYIPTENKIPGWSSLEETISHRVLVGMLGVWFVLDWLPSLPEGYLAIGLELDSGFISP